MGWSISSAKQKKKTKRLDLSDKELKIMVYDEVI